MSLTPRRTLFTIAVLASGLTLGAPVEAKAAVLSCELEDRSAAFFSDALPEEVQARIHCASQSMKLNGLHVAKLPGVQRDQLIAWFKRYEKAEAAGAKRTLILQRRGSTAADTWMEFESDLGEGKRLTHFLFTAPATDGQALVFVYTDSDTRARQFRGGIRDLSRAFRDKEYLNAIAQALL